MSASKLTSAQKHYLALISAAMPEGLLLDKGITAAGSLLRKGLVTREDVETAPATKFYTERHLTHTVRGRLRHVTMCRYRLASPSP